MKQRIFIGIDPSDELRQEIAGLQTRLEKLGLPIHFEPPEKLHLTLNFIGRVDKDDMGKFTDMIKITADEYFPFSLSPSFLETLYEKHGTSFIYLGLTGDLEILKNLNKSFKDRLSGLRIPQPKRYLPHITVGKFKKADPVLTKSFMDKIHDFDYSPLPGFTVDHISLYKSLLSRLGSHYQCIGRYMLK